MHTRGRDATVWFMLAPGTIKCFKNDKVQGCIQKFRIVRAKDHIDFALMPKTSIGNQKVGCTLQQKVFKLGKPV